METQEQLRPGQQIRQTTNCIKKFVGFYLSKHIDWNVTWAEGLMLGQIFMFQKNNPEKPLIAKEAMKFLNINKSATSKLLSNLETKGYIQMQQSTSDKRQKEILLSKSGIKIRKQMSQAFVNIDKIIEKDLTKEDIEDLTIILEKIKDNVKKGCGQNE